MMIIALLALGLLVFGCASQNISLPKTFPLFDCDSMQKTIEQSCDVQLTKMNWSGNNVCVFVSQDNKFQYYFNSRPLEPGFSGITDLKRAFDSTSTTYEELDFKDGALYRHHAPGSGSERDFDLGFFNGNYYYMVMTESRAGPEDDSHCVSKAGNLRLVGLLSGELFTNKTVTYAEQMPHR